MLLHPTRHYERTDDLVQEIINARVWGGVHYRQSVETGAVLGRKVVLGSQALLPAGELIRRGMRDAGDKAGATQALG